MGGRGSKLILENYLNRSREERMSEYEAIFVDGNIKFIMQKNGKRTAAPIFSNTENRIYVTIRPDGTIAGITQYDENHKQFFSINEPHSSDLIKQVHIHSSFEKGRKITYWDDMDKKHQELYLTIKKKYEEYDILNKSKEFNEKHGR